jgi:hypothetical protein
MILLVANSLNPGFKALFLRLFTLLSQQLFQHQLKLVSLPLLPESFSTLFFLLTKLFPSTLSSFPLAFQSLSTLSPTTASFLSPS